MISGGVIIAAKTKKRRIKYFENLIKLLTEITSNFIRESNIMGN